MPEIRGGKVNPSADIGRTTSVMPDPLDAPVPCPFHREDTKAGGDSR